MVILVESMNYFIRGYVQENESINRLLKLALFNLRQPSTKIISSSAYRNFDKGYLQWLRLNCKLNERTKQKHLFIHEDSDHLQVRPGIKLQNLMKIQVVNSLAKLSETTLLSLYRLSSSKVLNRTFDEWFCFGSSLSDKKITN